MNNYNYNNSNLVDPYIGFIRGNLFNDLYSQYKNYKPVEINPSNDKEYSMLLIKVYEFATHELTLYLDNYSNNTNIIKLRDEYRNTLNEAINNYEIKYGAISLNSSVLAKTPWGWDTKFPWEVDN